MQKRDTVGKISSDLLQKKQGPVRVLDQAAEMQRDWPQLLIENVMESRKVHPSDFYIDVQVKAEPLMPNVIRPYFVAKIHCPTPNYDQNLFKYNAATEQIEFLWTIPDRETCKYLLKHAAIVDKSEWDLLKFVQDFKDGILFKKMKILNGEKLETPELENK